MREREDRYWTFLHRMTLATESVGRSRQSLSRQFQVIIGLTTNTLRNDNGERYDGIVLTGLNQWHHRIITHINSQQRVPSIGENLSYEFGNLTNRSVNNAVFASLPVELRDAYLRGMEL